MNVFNPVTQENVKEIWPLIDDSAEKELQFPQKALAHFRAIFTDDELIRRYDSHLAPVLFLHDGNAAKGVLIGSAPEGGVGTIIWLIVAPAFRGQGVGRLLFESACGFYRSAGAHKIKLTASTRAAVDFYKKQGMDVEGFHPNHWWNLDFWSLGLIMK